jgi:hypothetical protein
MALRRWPHHPQVLPSQPILERSRAVAAMALRPHKYALGYRAVLDRQTTAVVMPLHRQPPWGPQRNPSRVTLGRRRAVTVALQPPPASPLRLGAILDPRGAVLRTALPRRPYHLQVLPPQAILDRSRALATMVPRRPQCPLGYRVVLDRWRAVAAMAFQPPPASATTILRGPRAARSLGLRRPPACLLRLRALPHRCKLAAAVAL